MAGDNFVITLVEDHKIEVKTFREFVGWCSVAQILLKLHRKDSWDYQN